MPEGVIAKAFSWSTLKLLHKHRSSRAGEPRQRAGGQHRRRALPERRSSTPRNTTMAPQNAAKTTQPHHQGGATSSSEHPSRRPPPRTLPRREEHAQNRGPRPDRQVAGLEPQRPASPRSSIRRTGRERGETTEQHAPTPPPPFAAPPPPPHVRKHIQPGRTRPGHRSHTQPRAQPHTPPGRLPHRTAPVATTRIRAPLPPLHPSPQA
jgi:hypothetical protein